MLHIAVCDDEMIIRRKIKEDIENYLEELQMDYVVDLFSSGIDFVSQGIEMTKYHIVFLDIEMGGLDGIQTAKTIREVSREVFIVFVTAHIGYSLEGYTVGATRYLLKSDADFINAIHECIASILKEMDYNDTKMHFSFREGAKNVSLEKILYIESKLHKLEFNVMEKELLTYSLYGSLNETEHILSEYGFIRIHQSFLLNLRHLTKISGYKAILNTCKSFTISKARYKNVKKTFIAYKTAD